MIPQLITLTLGALALARPVLAQCRDGTPPPCARVVVPGPYSVAVLAFENRAGDTSLTLLAEGLADQITTNLGQVQRLELRPPASVRFVLGRTPREPARLARALRSRWLVDGQLLSSEGRVRVSVQLIDAANQRVRWTGGFERPTEDLFAVISAVADSVATAIIGTLAPVERARLVLRPTISNAAMTAYTRGMAALHHHDEPSARYAVTAFEGASAADSMFAQAWAGLAEALMWLDDYAPPRQLYPRARAAAQRALELAPGSAAPLAALAGVAVAYDWDPPRADSLARSALRQDSTYARAWVYLGDALAAEGRANEAVSAYRAAVAADTLDEQVATDATFGLGVARRPDEALALARRWRTSLPQSESWGLAEAVILVGARRCSSSPPVSPITPLALACAGRVSAARSAADSIVAQVERGERYVPAVDIAATFVALGDQEAALRWLARAVEDRSYPMVALSVAPLWDQLRGDPRFAELLQRIRPAKQ